MKKQARKKQPVKKKAPAFNVDHEDIRDSVEVAFKVGTTPYFRFKDDLRMPAGRYKYVYSYMREADLRMDLNTLKAFIAEMKRCLNGEKKQIDIENAWRLIFNLEGRANLAFEPETIKRLASVVYFDKTEDLSTFDKKHAAIKIKKWEKANSLDFFLSRPMSEYLQLTGTSITSLEEYLSQAEVILQELTSGLPPQLQESLSVNGKKTSSSLDNPGP